ncbi:hypothetical protein [Polyangium mundeleinium]|uniref:Uncharacterized protein n=1 Tax=Polyangium mundeleinium TaxID=2995306 RepID=A0ABT5EHB1_9BACT|nr:hypothetical protein [Polyangium mundeleinium]MDC0740125.1 hypothetical protein [Polyangium mundeleinium]
MSQHEDRYRVPANLPSARRRARLNAEEQQELRENLLWLAETRQSPEEPAAVSLERNASEVMAVWFERPGKDNFLRNHRHPLARLCQDFADVATALLVRDKAKASATPKPAFVPTLRERSQGEQEQVRAGLQGVLAVLKRPAAKGAAA